MSTLQPPKTIHIQTKRKRQKKINNKAYIAALIQREDKNQPTAFSAEV